jgi:hypothetical protein
MSIALTQSEMEYIHSEEFQHPKTRPERRRAEALKRKWIHRASHDGIFQQALMNALKEKK